jgi:hypothetical protein
MRSALSLALVAALFLAAGRADQPPSATTLAWSREGNPPTVLTLYANGTFANAKGEKRNYRWAWTEEGLLLKFWTARYVFRPVAGEPGRFSGELVRTKPDQEPVAVQIAIEGADGAGVLAWLQPIIDGPQPSALEQIADAQAQQIVLSKLTHEVARLDAAARALERAEIGAQKAGRAEVTAERAVEAKGDVVGDAHQEAREWHGKMIRRLGPQYSVGSFVNALAEWNQCEDRREQAEKDLDRARQDLDSARDRLQRAEAGLRKVEAEYAVAAADYQVAYLIAWRPVYLQRKAALKAESAARLSLPGPLPTHVTEK